MTALVSIVAGVLACLAFVGAFYRLSGRLKELETERQPAPEPPAPAGHRGSGARPMLTALYHEPAPSPLQGVTAAPGGGWLLLAVGMTLVAMVSSRLGARPGPVATPATPDSAVIRLAQRVDSLASTVGQLRDSLRVVRPAETPARAPATATRIARRPAAPSSGILPAAPPPPVSP